MPAVYEISAVRLNGTVGTVKPSVQELKIPAGEDANVVTTVVDPAGVVLDIDTWDFELRVTRTLGDPPLLTVAGTPDVDTTTGLVTFTMSDTDTGDLSGLYYYDVWLTDGTDTIRVVPPSAVVFDLS